jgi:DNA polymerase I
LKLALFDTEGNGLLDTITRMHCAVVEDYKTGERTIFRPENISFLPAFLSTFDGIICHNLLGYDLPVMRKLFGWEYKGKLIDTLLISRTQRPERPSLPGYEATPHSIEAYGIRFGSPKQEHEDWSVFSEDMLSRCVQDVAILRKVYDFLIEEGKGENWREAHRLNHALFYHLQRQEEYGWLVDRDWFSRCIRILDRYIAKIDVAVTPLLPLITEKLESKKDGVYGYIQKPFRKDGSHSASVRAYWGDNSHLVSGPFSRISFRTVDLNSNLETKAFLLASGWIPKEWNRDKDGNETSPKLSKQDPFEGIAGRTGKLIARRVQCRHRKSQIEGWLDAIRPDGRIGARVAGIASTGRLRHAVIVNVPNQDAFFGEHMRKGFIAKPGYVLVGTDSKGNQMRQLIGRMKALDGVGDVEFEKAELTGDKAKGTDLHSVNQRRAGLASRTLAKNFFYGCILFGAGDRKTAQIMGPGTTILEAKAKKDEFFSGLPVLRRLLDTEIVKWRATAQMVYNWRFKRMEYKNGYITGLDGRPILVEFEKDILVYYLQSDEAIQMAAAYCVLHKWLERAGYAWGQDYGFVIWMHDEWQIEVRKEIADEVVKLSNEAIAWAGRYFNIQCPHEGESKVGINWAETH